MVGGMAPHEASSLAHTGLPPPAPLTYASGKCEHKTRSPVVHSAAAYMQRMFRALLSCMQAIAGLANKPHTQLRLVLQGPSQQIPPAQ
jgi:hypothetical protein